MVDHFREEDEFFPAVMVAVGITADKIKDFGKFLLVDFSPFQNSAT